MPVFPPGKNKQTRRKKRIGFSILLQRIYIFRKKQERGQGGIRLPALPAQNQALPPADPKYKREYVPPQRGQFLQTSF